MPIRCADARYADAAAPAMIRDSRCRTKHIYACDDDHDMRDVAAQTMLSSDVALMRDMIQHAQDFDDARSAPRCAHV